MLGLSLSLGACGVSTSGSPRAISKSLVPSAAVTTTTVSSSCEIPVVIVLLDSATNAPAPVARCVPQQLDNLHTVLTDLLAGPGRDELESKDTAIPQSTRLLAVYPNPVGTPAVVPTTPVTVNLSLEFSDVTGLSQVLAIEQVVLTVACDLSPSAPTAIRVLFQIDGTPFDVPILDGGLVNRAVTAADYLPPNGTLDCSTS